MHEIKGVDSVTNELVEAFARMLPQLSPTCPSLSTSDLQEIVAGPSTRLLVARDREGQIVGSVTAVAFRIPTGLRGRIESLVVDQSARGRGAGAALCQAAIELLQRLGVDCIDLTSGPARESANHLYGRLGFQRRDTNVYRLESPSGQEDEDGVVSPSSPRAPDEGASS
jgi:ribosomal protein S18 acetylase RimI-like enzyme